MGVAARLTKRVPSLTFALSKLGMHPSAAVAMHAFAAFIHKEPDTAFGVSFPDAPGCVTVAESWAEVPNRAREVLTFHLEGLREHGLPQPRPRDLEAILRDPELADDRESLAAIVMVELEPA